MRKVSVLVLILIELLFLNIYAQMPNFHQSSSTSCGYWFWGSDWWSPGTNHEFRYAESQVTFLWTESPYHPTYLNVACGYSQAVGTVTIDIYISTEKQINIDMQNDPHFHQHWWNGDSVNLGHYVGQVVADFDGELVSFNIEDWIVNNPPISERWGYYLLFDQNDDPNDAAIIQAWLGPLISVVGVEEPSKINIPNAYMLYQNYPNPFNPTTTIKFILDKSSNIKLVIYDALGRQVREILDEFYSPGEYSVTWDGKDESGNLVSSGQYFYTIEREGSVELSRKAAEYPNL